MSLLRRIEKKPGRKLLRNLLEALPESETLHPPVDALLQRLMDEAALAGDDPVRLGVMVDSTRSFVDLFPEPKSGEVLPPPSIATVKRMLLRSLLETLADSETLRPSVDALLLSLMDAATIKDIDSVREGVVEQSTRFFLYLAREPKPLQRQHTPYPKDPDSLEQRFLNFLVQELDHFDGSDASNRIREQAQTLLPVFLEAEGHPHVSRQRERDLVDYALAELIGFSVLEPLLADDEIEEILVQGTQAIDYRNRQTWMHSDLHFDNSDHVLRIIDRIIARYGEQLDEGEPMLNTVLPDGSQVVAMHPTATTGWPMLYIRKTLRKALDLDQLRKIGTLNAVAAELLVWCIKSGVNVLITGNHLAGKTTLLNALLPSFPPNELTPLIQDALLLESPNERMPQFQTRPPNAIGWGEITRRQMVNQALRMNPAAVVVDKAEGREVLDLVRDGRAAWAASLRCRFYSDVPGLLRALIESEGLSYERLRFDWAAAPTLVVHMQ